VRRSIEQRNGRLFAENWHDQRLLESPERSSATDDRGGRKRPKIASIERVSGLRLAPPLRKLAGFCYAPLAGLYPTPKWS
jgi:hypothetical protein